MRDEEEIKGMLVEHLRFLKASFKEFDDGNFYEAKRIANSVYTIVFDKGRTTSLLTQLGIKSDIKLIASGKDHSSEKNKSKSRYESPPLLMMRTDAHGFEFKPKLGGILHSQRIVSFKTWWNGDTIYRYHENVDGVLGEFLLTRKDLVLSLTDQDGGRHFDPVLGDRRYRRMKEVSDLRNVETGKPFDLYIELLTMRQIGWELVESLRRLGLDTTIGNVHGIKKGAEIYDNKCRFYPHEKNLYRNIKLEEGIVPGHEYLVDIIVDRITTGNLRIVLNSRVTDPITNTGLHRIQLVAGVEGYSGIFCEYTDAIVDRLSVTKIEK